MPANDFDRSNSKVARDEGVAMVETSVVHSAIGATGDSATPNSGMLTRGRRGLQSTRRLLPNRARLGWWLARGLAFALFLTAWQLAADHGLLSKFFFSRPSDVGRFLLNYAKSGDIVAPVVTTVRETVLAFAFGGILGIVSGIILATFRPVRMLLAPFLTALNALPRVALAPLFILWFGIGETSKVYLGASLVYFIVLINTESGILAVDREYITVVRSLGAKRIDTLKLVVLPATVPAVFSGLRVGLIYSLLGVVTAEMVAAKTGLGQAVIELSALYNTGGVLGVLFILSLIALILNEIMAVLEKRLTRWRT